MTDKCEICGEESVLGCIECTKKQALADVEKACNDGKDICIKEGDIKGAAALHGILAVINALKETM